MEFKTIEKLLAKYLDGETSLEEEAFLKAYFTKEQELPAEWVPFRQFFTYCDEARKETFPQKSIIATPSFKPWMLVAASIALVLTLQLSGVFETQPSPFEAQQAEMAFQQFQLQMKTVSIHLNKGAEKVAFLDYWNDTTQKLLK